MRTAPKAPKIKSFSCTRGQKDPSQRGAFVPNKDENANYKKKFVFALSYLKIKYSQCTNDDDSNGTAFALKI